MTDLHDQLRDSARRTAEAFAAFRDACEQLTREAMQTVSADQARRIRQRVEQGEPIFDAIVAVLDEDGPVEPPF